MNLHACEILIKIVHALTSVSVGISMKQVFLALGDIVEKLVERTLWEELNTIALKSLTAGPGVS